MRNYFKYFLYLYVFICYFSASAGSYEDFFTAVKRDDAVTINNLISRGFDPNTLSPDAEHALFMALREPSLKAADALLNAKRIDVEVRNRNDESPLMIASLKGLTEVAQILVKLGADVNKPGWTPLHYAATSGHLPIIRLLLDNYAYIDASSPNESTPLMLAAMYGSPSAVKLLLEAGADPSIKNQRGLTALDFARTAKRPDSESLIAAFIRAKQPKGQW